MTNKVTDKIDAQIKRQSTALALIEQRCNVALGRGHVNKGDLVAIRAYVHAAQRGSAGDLGLLGIE